MNDQLRRFWRLRSRRARPVARTADGRGVCLASGVIVMPCLIFAVGRLALGPYAHGSVFALWRDFMHWPGFRLAGGLVHRRSGRTCCCGCCAAAAGCYITDPSGRCRRDRLSQIRRHCITCRPAACDADPRANSERTRRSTGRYSWGKHPITTGESSAASSASHAACDEVFKDIALALVTNHGVGSESRRGGGANPYDSRLGTPGATSGADGDRSDAPALELPASAVAAGWQWVARLRSREQSLSSAGGRLSGPVDDTKGDQHRRQHDSVA